MGKVGTEHPILLLSSRLLYIDTKYVDITLKQWARLDGNVKTNYDSNFNTQTGLEQCWIALYI